MKKGKQKLRQKVTLKREQREEEEETREDWQKQQGDAAGVGSRKFCVGRKWEDEEGEKGEKGNRKGGGSKRRKISRGHSQEQQKLEAREQSGGAGSEEDDFPEEVTMTQGRQEVEKRRQEERESKRRIAAEAKRRRQQRSCKKGADDKKLGISGIAQLPNCEQNEDREQNEFSHPAEEAQLQTGDESHYIGRLLDDKIVQFLTAREQAQAPSSGNKPRDATLRSMKSQRSATRLESEINGRVKLVLLEGLSSSQNQSALEFRHDRLFGSRTTRSFSMLRKSNRIVIHS
eukprot:c25258_g1_i1 orf=451-1314(+)